MQTTIYIRKDNEEAWNQIEDKSRFVNMAVENLTSNKNAVYSQPIKTPEQKFYGEAIVEEMTSIQDKLDKSHETPSNEQTLRKSLRNRGMDDSIVAAFDVKKLCPHGAGPRLCKEKKCKNYQFGRK